MIKRIIHLADLHIRTYQFHDLYRKQFSLLLEDLEKQVSGFKFSEIRVVIVGDIAHNKINISNEQMMLTSWFIKELADKIGKVIIIPGNHDFLFLQQNFGENVNHHGYGLYDFETKEYTTHDIENEQPFLHFSISDISDIENEKEILLNNR
jgi:metallophosphoesterase superfamily enzyme